MEEAKLEQRRALVAIILTLMEDFCGIPAHAQIINVRQGKGEIMILLTSVFPLSRTKVWHSDGDAPYWEIGLHLQ